jgi:hypothetical protein
MGQSEADAHARQNQTLSRSHALARADGVEQQIAAYINSNKPPLAFVSCRP